MSEYPIDFCTHLALAIKKRQKTATHKLLSRRELTLHDTGKLVPSPYGQAGDTLWVREPFGSVGARLVYQADYAVDGYRGSVFLPAGFEPSPDEMTRQQARRLLTVTAVSIVSLQTVDEAAAKAAGTIPTGGRSTYLDEFKVQWNDAYRTQGWATNPLCWYVTFTLQ